MSSISLSLGPVVNKEAALFCLDQRVYPKILIINNYVKIKQFQNYSDSDDSNLLKAHIQSRKR